MIFSLFRCGAGALLLILPLFARARVEKVPIREDFEKGLDTARWAIVSENEDPGGCVAVKSTSAFAGRWGLFVARQGVAARLHLPAGEDFCREGFYLQYAFKVNAARLPVPRGDTATLMMLTAISTQDKVVRLAALHLLTDTGGGAGLDFQPLAGRQRLAGFREYGWNTVKLFIRLEEGGTTDSLFLNGNLVHTAAIAQPQKIELVRALSAGLFFTTLPAERLSLDLDEITLSRSPPPLPQASPDKAFGEGTGRLFVNPFREKNSTVRCGDTLLFSFEFPPRDSSFFIDFNLRSETFKGLTLDRFGAFDPQKNRVFSFTAARKIYYKGKKGETAWMPFPTAGSNAKDYPATSLDAGRFAIHPATGTASVVFIIDPEMDAGVWTFSAKLQSGGLEKTVFPSGKMTVTSSFPSTAMGALILALILSVIGIAMAALFLLKKRRALSEKFSEKWLAITREVESVLLAHFADPELDSEAIAKKIGLSRQRLLTIYLSVKGKSPVRRLREIRIDEAGRLLKNSKESIAEIAYKVGFTHPHIFIRNFKKLTRKTPGDFRNS